MAQQQSVEMLAFNFTSETVHTAVLLKAWADHCTFSQILCTITWTLSLKQINVHKYVDDVGKALSSPKQLVSEQFLNAHKVSRQN